MSVLCPPTPCFQEEQAASPGPQPSWQQSPWKKRKQLLSSGRGGAGLPILRRGEGEGGA